MTAEVVWELFNRFGLPLGMLALALWTGSLGVWIFRRQHEAILKGKDDQLASLKERLAEMRTEHTEDTRLLREERDRAVALAMEGWGRAEHALDIVGVPKPSPVQRRRRVDAA